MKNRKQLRMVHFDYSQDGYYFITTCTQNREPFFGTIKNNEMQLNQYGEIVKEQWLWLSQQYKYIELDEYIIMHNHFHGIIRICRGGYMVFVGVGCNPPLQMWNPLLQIKINK